MPYFSGRRLASITTSDVRAYVAKRQADRTVVSKAYDVLRKDGSTAHIPERRREINAVSNGEINRELTILKRIFTLAIQGGKLLHRPHIALLQEHNTRMGFFEPEQLASVISHLPESLRPVIQFAAVTGWRIDSEVCRSNGDRSISREAKCDWMPAVRRTMRRAHSR